MIYMSNHFISNWINTIIKFRSPINNFTQKTQIHHLAACDRFLHLIQSVSLASSEQSPAALVPHQQSDLGSDPRMSVGKWQRCNYIQ